MLKRKDLAKEFELVVKQEIKNHNDAVNNTNVNLEKFKALLKDLDKNLKLETAVRNSQIVNLNSNSMLLIEDLSYAFEEKINKLKLKLSMLMDDLYKLKNSIEFMRDDESVINKIDNMHNKIIDFGEKYDSEIKKIKEIIDFNARIETTKNKTYCDSKISKLEEKPAHLEIVKRDLFEKIKEFRCDNETLISDVQNFRKIIFVQEKKIENLYILNNRLKSKIDALERGVNESCI